MALSPWPATAAIESAAENTTDSYVGPWLAFALFGLPGAVAYRALNTLDSMIGYRGRYEHLGKASARLDDRRLRRPPGRRPGEDRPLPHRQHAASADPIWYDVGKAAARLAYGVATLAVPTALAVETYRGLLSG